MGLQRVGHDLATEQQQDQFLSLQITKAVRGQWWEMSPSPLLGGMGLIPWGIYATLCCLPLAIYPHKAIQAWSQDTSP